jgi:uncharacterized membrane protein YjjP (DUF1212 family)
MHGEKLSLIDDIQRAILKFRMSLKKAISKLMNKAVIKT